MPRVILRVLFVVAAVASIFVATTWGVRPFLHPPAGLHPTGRTYSQVIRDRYPRHLIDPAWLRNDINRSLTETAARLGVVSFGLACIFVLWIFTRHEHQSVKTTDPAWLES